MSLVQFMHRSRIFCQMGCNFDVFFFVVVFIVNEGREDPIQL